MIINTTDGRQIFKKAESLCVVPYRYDETIDDYVIGSDVYDLTAIIGDSISLSNSEGSTTTINNEFSGEAIVRNNIDQAWTISAQCADLQNRALRAIFGAYTTDVAGISVLPQNMPTIYALIRIRFKSDNPDIYLPKVLLNSQLTISQLKSGSAQGTIRGTAYSRLCVIKDPTTSNGLVEMSSVATDETKFMVNSPILFVNQSYSPLFLHHGSTETTDYVFTHVMFTETNGSSSAHNIHVDVTQSVEDGWVYTEE